MQSFYPECFERDMSTTELEWLMRLPQAIGAHDWHREGAEVVVHLAQGRLRIQWETAPARVLALVRLPRLWVRFAFTGADAPTRLHFMRRFDLTMQRGGG